MEVSNTLKELFGSQSFPSDVTELLSDGFNITTHLLGNSFYESQGLLSCSECIISFLGNRKGFDFFKAFKTYKFSLQTKNSPWF